MTPLEIAANGVTTLSIWLAARNSRHTWSTGIVGCVLFAVQFYRVQLYADVTLQIFFLGTSVLGWRQWRCTVGATATTAAERPVTRASTRALMVMGVAALIVTAGYGFLLHTFTDAYMPYVDSAVLALSVVAQCLLMRRHVETWPAWLAVNTLSVPLYASRGLWLTAGLYAAYWVNAWYGWARWRKAARAADAGDDGAL